jgi:hypothetical protein
VLVRPITTIVIAVGRLGIDNDEILAASLCLLDLVFAELLEEDDDQEAHNVVDLYHPSYNSTCPAIPSIEMASEYEGMSEGRHLKRL